MSENIPLHWSFDYNQGSQKPTYARELLELLHLYKENSDLRNDNTVNAQHRRQVYQILPNFWHGYQRRNNQSESISIGEVVVERRQDKGSIWKYNIRYINKTNGEELSCSFSCRDEIYRPLHGKWHVEAHNSCDDIYTKLSWNGYLTSVPEIQFRINNTDITAGKIDNSLPITCNWALFDVCPALVESNNEIDGFVEIAILDDLEQFRPKCRIGYLDTIESPISLVGFFVYGTGSLPSYWWVDTDGNTVIVSSVFETLVLKVKMG